MHVPKLNKIVFHTKIMFKCRSNKNNVNKSVVSNINVASSLCIICKQALKISYHRIINKKRARLYIHLDYSMMNQNSMIQIKQTRSMHNT